jgi:hypothetical protein
VLALSLTMILTACGTPGQIVNRTLPPESSVVLDPVAEPRIRPGDDARVAWKKEEAARIEANARLVKSRVIYRGIRKRYGAK